jgi:LacI family transcriptional regulator
MAKQPYSTQKPKKKTGTPTLEMVARKAGVSPSTVSRILNGTARVSEAKKTAIKSAIDKLGFVANPMASGLAGGKSRSIGVITQALGSPFYGQGLLGIEDVLIKENFASFFVSSHWRKADEQRCINSLEMRHVDGIIILTACLPDATLTALAAKTPLVITGRNLSTERLISISFDNFLGARLATEYLISLGHTRIAFIKGTSSHPDAVERFRGYAAALKSHGIPLDDSLVARGNFVESGGESAAEALLQSKVPMTAIFAANDQMAYGAALALYRRGIRIPDDISLVGFDDLATSEFTLPPLTSVRHSIYEIGALAAKTMIQLIQGQTPTLVVPKPELIVRDSTRPPAIPFKHKLRSG